MKQVYILGHFAFGKNESNGQTIKTKIVANALQDLLGKDEIGLEDTHGRWRFLLRLPLSVFRCVRHGRHVVMMPAYKGILLITPLLAFFNLFFRRRLHYVVVGGWLPSYARRFPLLRHLLRGFNHIYVETQSMRNELCELHFRNVTVMPNCKPLTVVPKEQLPAAFDAPYRLCTFSRVIKEKGIEDAVEALNKANRLLGAPTFVLHIYGQIEQPEWFEGLMASQPETIRYCGVVPFTETTDILKDYFALLFPTYYRGEAFAGTLIDAFAAGLPVIATDWHANAEVVTHGENGLLYPVRSVEALTDILVEAARRPDAIIRMRQNCLARADRYQPEVVLQALVQNLKE